MNDGYRVRIFESELRVIGDETLDFPDIETGGNLYGLLSRGGAPVVSLATRPAGKIHRGPVSLELDHKVQQAIEELLWARYGIQFLGMWHSHHQIGLYEPSEGDRSRTASYAAKSARKFYLEILCNLPLVTHSMRPTVAVPSLAMPDGGVSVDDTGEAGEDQKQDETRRSRRAQEKEERRRARDATREADHGVYGPAHRQGRSGNGRAAGPVRMTPFVYVDATRLHRADAEFAVLPGTSPLRTAVWAADLPGVLGDAFRPVSGEPAASISYELRWSNADRFGRYGGEVHPPGPLGQPADVPRSQQEKKEIQAPAGPRQVPADTTTAVSSMTRYIADHLEPLIRTRPEYLSTLESISERKLALRVRGASGRAELLLVLGLDGAVPIVLSCAIMRNDVAVSWPDRLDSRDVSSHFYWGVKRLSRWG